MNIRIKCKQAIGRLLQNFRNKYLLALLIVSLVPLLITFSLVIYTVSKQFETHQINILLDTTKVASQNLNRRVEQLQMASKSLAGYLLGQLSTVRTETDLQSYAELQRCQGIRNTIYNMENMYNLTRIRIFSDHIPYLHASNHINFFDMSMLDAITTAHPEMLEKSSFNRLNYIEQEQYKVFYSNPRPAYLSHVLSFYCGIYNAKQDLIAMSLIDCTSDSILQYITDAINTGSAMVINHNGKTICSSMSQEAQSKLIDCKFNAQGYTLWNHQLVTYYDVPLLNWTLILSMPFNSSINVWEALGDVYIVIFLLTFILAISAGIFISNLQAQRLHNYSLALQGIDYAKPQTFAALPDELDMLSARIKHPDEVDQVIISFGMLIRDNLKLIESSKQHEMEIEKYKFKVLQEQINPHFLYNALETLRLCIMLERKHDALTSLDALSKFYRIALSKGRDTISIREELDMIHNYLDIENIGYNGSIHWSIDVTEECLDLPIPKFLLQPLVENSILHSRPSNSSMPLVLSIQGCICDDMLRMAVTDNGVGIDPATLRNIMAGFNVDTMRRSDKGFGLRNINRRLNLFYGKEYGLKIHSVPGCTENIIQLPLDILW